MAKAWLDQVFDRHREPWHWVESQGCRVALAGSWMLWGGICRVNRHLRASF